MLRRLRVGRARRGQALVELALVFPLLVLLIAGIIVIGIGIFYQQQVTNAAREAARYASVHSATAQCPTVSTLDPLGSFKPKTYTRCDAPAASWPKMTNAARSLLFGLDPASVRVAACWSGYVDGVSYDAPPPGDYVISGSTVTITSSFSQCLINGADPTTDPSGIGCGGGLSSATTDRASALSEGPGRVVANTVTGYACYVWSPPMAGFLLIPQTITFRGVLTEPIERQQ